jgi:hypothetical protein
MSEGGKVGKLSTPSDAGKSRDKIAAQLGISGRTYEKQRAVVAAAEAEPEKYGKLLADMDRTHRVNGVYRRLKIARQAEAVRREPPPLPGHGPYRVLCIDIPWPYEFRDEDPSHRGALPYLTMPIEQICKIDINALMHPPDGEEPRTSLAGSSCISFSNGGHPRAHAVRPAGCWAPKDAKARTLSSSCG